MEAESFNQITWLLNQRKCSKKISDGDSDDAFLASQTSQSSSCYQPKKTYRFLSIHAEKDESISPPPFLVHKTIMGLTGFCLMLNDASTLVGH